MEKPEAKMVRFIPSGKRLPYWDKYEFECVDCGSHYFSGHYNSRTLPYCAECSRKHERERARERKEKMIAEHDKRVREKCLKEFTLWLKTYYDISDKKNGEEMTQSELLGEWEFYNHESLNLGSLVYR